MSAGSRLAAFGVAAALALAGGAALGAAVGPIDPADPPPRHAPARDHTPPTTGTHDAHPTASR